MRVALFAIALILGEIAAFVVVGRWLGVLPVLTLVVLAGMVGVALMRSTGAATSARLRAAMQGRENPLAAAGSAAFRVVAGLLLVVPGFVTDVLALLLLLPPVQRALVARVAARARGAAMAQVLATVRGRHPQGDQVIEGQAQEVPPPAEDGNRGPAPGTPPRD